MKKKIYENKNPIKRLKELANLIDKHKQTNGLPDDETIADICAGFQEAVVDTLVIKCSRAAEASGSRTLVIAGGVSANSRLRHKLEVVLEKEGVEVFYARHEFCTDNGAMIAYAGCQRLLAGQSNNLQIYKGGRFYYLADNYNKGTASMKFLKIVKFSEKINFKTISVGDDENDISMLEQTDYSCIIKRQKVKIPLKKNTNIYYSINKAPDGWRESIEFILKKENENR